MINGSVVPGELGEGSVLAVRFGARIQDVVCRLCPILIGEENGVALMLVGPSLELLTLSRPLDLYTFDGVRMLFRFFRGDSYFERRHPIACSAVVRPLLKMLDSVK